MENTEQLDFNRRGARKLHVQLLDLRALKYRRG
jgi:hypothetical protein